MLNLKYYIILKTALFKHYNLKHLNHDEYKYIDIKNCNMELFIDSLIQVQIVQSYQ